MSEVDYEAKYKLVVTRLKQLVAFPNDGWNDDLENIYCLLVEELGETVDEEVG